MNIGPSLEGAYDAAMATAVEGWSIRKRFKKIGRGVKKGVKKGYKAGKRIHKTAVKVSLKPVKLAIKAGKYALMAAAKLAAKPIVWSFRKLAGRRAGYLAYKATGSSAANAMQKREAASWALKKMGGAGPIGKLAVRILKFVGAHKSSGAGGRLAEQWINSRKVDEAMCGMTGAEIAAAAAAIVGAMAKLMSSLNKPGEAPANPAAAAKKEHPEEETQPVIEDSEEEDSAGFFRPMARLKRIKRRALLRKKRGMIRRGVAPQAGPRKRKLDF